MESPAGKCSGLAAPRRPLLAGSVEHVVTWLLPTSSPAYYGQHSAVSKGARCAATQAGAAGEARAAAHAPGRAGSYGAPGARRAAPPAAGSRAAALAAFVPERAAAAGGALAGALEVRLRALPPAALGPPGAVVAEEALLLGGALPYTLPRRSPCFGACRSAPPAQPKYVAPSRPACAAAAHPPAAAPRGRRLPRLHCLRRGSLSAAKRADVWAHRAVRGGAGRPGDRAAPGAGAAGGVAGGAG